MTPQELAAEFPLGPDSLPQPGVPTGRLEKLTHADSRIFPGTERDWWIYVPAQYDPAQPAGVMIVQDGAEHLKPERRWHIPTILDNLIHRQEMPVTIGVFINPGVVPSAIAGAAPRANRSFEYDSLGDRYARFLLEEILPEVERRYQVRRDGNSRCIMGGSSGAFCAFNAAWERPAEFSRVLSIVGSYTALRGGHEAAPLVRLTEPKPLRIFLQSGARDLRVFAGDWWTGNLEMASALEYAGYEVSHIWAEHAGHDEFHGSTIFPDAMRWVWKNYPQEISRGVGSQQPVTHWLAPDEPWREVEGDYPSSTALARDAEGAVLFVSPDDRSLYRIGREGRAEKLRGEVEGVAGIACGPAGEIYACQPGRKRVIVLDATGQWSVALDGVEPHSVSVAPHDGLYVTEPAQRRIWLLPKHGEPRAFVVEIAAPGAVRLAVDQGSLLVSDVAGMNATVFSVLPDGSLANASPYFRLQGRDGETNSGTEQIVTSPAGWSLFATRIGLQLGEQSGLVAGIVPLPGGTAAMGVALGGQHADEVFVSSGRRVYRRRIRPDAILWR